MEDIPMSMTLGEARARRAQVNVHEGEGALIGGEEFARMVGSISCTVTFAVELDNRSHFLKLISCLIFTESFYATSLSYKVIQTLATGLYKVLMNPPYATPKGSGGTQKIHVNYKFYTRTPCIRPVDLPKVGGKAIRNFSVVGNAQRCGFIEYNFSLTVHHLRANEVGRIEGDYYKNVEEHLSDLKCKTLMKRIAEIRKDFTQFRLADYLGLLNYSHKGRQLGKIQSFPDGWLESSLAGEPSQPKSPEPLTRGAKAIAAIKTRVWKKKGD